MTTFITSALVDDGYNGKVSKVFLVYDNGQVLEVHESGYHKSCIPLASSLQEAQWLLDNHPGCRNHYFRKGV